VIIASILIVSPSRSSSEFVWTKYNNETNISNTGYVCCIGLLMCLFSFSGYEAGAHMAEETKNASASAPRGILLTCIVTALTGFTYIIGLLYAC
jgi:amino acid transporter